MTTRNLVGCFMVIAVLAMMATVSMAQETPAPTPTPAAAPAPEPAPAPAPSPPPAADPTPAPVAEPTPAPAPAATQPPASATTESTPPPPAAPSNALTSTSQPKITLWQMLKWGGVILWCIIALGMVAMAMSIYFLITITPTREAPPTLIKRVIAQIRTGDLRGAYQICEGREELAAAVIRAGLRMTGQDRYVIQEAMESEGERGVMDISQKIFYLNNIGTIAPLIGLLGTVWGMVLAFSSIASDNAQVKSMAVASSVSKAMICTVGGLVVAIPSLSVYYYLRGRVVKIIAAVEAQSSEIIALLDRGNNQ